MRLIDADILTALISMAEFKYDTTEPTREVDMAAIGRMINMIIIETINDMPTVEAVPARHGRWLNERYGVKFDGHSYPFRKIGTCSECHETSCDAGDYCPNCGAKMDGKGEE